VASHPIVLDEFDQCQFDQAATAQFAVDGDVEQSQIAQLTRQFEPRPDRPYLFRR